jgi:hypothetical protein
MMIHGENTSKILKIRGAVMQAFRDRGHTEVTRLRMVQTQVEEGRLFYTKFSTLS